jgi:predicted RNA-binding Zn-ribbon protein involved in translation (DUF1610 family)
MTLGRLTASLSQRARKFKVKRRDNPASGDSRMKLPSWIKLRYLRKPASQASLTECPKCGKEMRLVDRSSMSGNDMRTYRCDDCREEHIVDFGTALWKILSDAGQGDK